MEIEGSDPSGIWINPPGKPSRPAEVPASGWMYSGMSTSCRRPWVSVAATSPAAGAGLKLIRLTFFFYISPGKEANHNPGRAVPRWGKLLLKASESGCSLHLDSLLGPGTHLPSCQECWLLTAHGREGRWELSHPRFHFHPGKVCFQWLGPTSFPNLGLRPNLPIELFEASI